MVTVGVKGLTPCHTDRATNPYADTRYGTKR